MVGASAALRWCDRLLKWHGLVLVDVSPSNMIATCGGTGTSKAVQVLDVPAGIVGGNGVMRFLALEAPMSADGRQQVHSTANTKHDHAPAGSEHPHER